MMAKKGSVVVSDSAAASSSDAAAAAAAPPPEPSGLYFQGVVQCDFPNQMDVLRWLEHDTSYVVIYIKHDRDVFTQEEIAERAAAAAKAAAKAGASADECKRIAAAPYFTRKNGDGSESQYKSGDIKPAHIHFLLKTSHKMRASTLCKRFSKQLFFERTVDRFESARYLTHETFGSRLKVRYDRDEIVFCSGGLEMYNELMKEESSSAASVVQRFIDTLDGLRASGVQEDNLVSQAVRAVVSTKDSVLLASIMSHGYFYDKMLK